MAALGLDYCGGADMKLDERDVDLALASAKIGIWKWYVDSRPSTWSPTLPALVGSSEEDFDGTLDGFLAFVHPDEKDAVRTRVDAALENKEQDFAIEHRLLVDDKLRWLCGRGSVLLGSEGEVIGLMAIMRDLTEGKHAPFDVESEGEPFRLYSELASDYIYSIDLLTKNLVPSIVAGSFQRTTGYAVEELEEHGGWLSIVHPDDAAKMESLMGELAKGLPLVNEYRITTKSGELRWLRDRIHPIMSSAGQLIGLKGGVQDISDRKNLEAQLYHTRKMESLAHLAGSVAHDFNNLLTVMFAANSMLGAECSSESGKEALSLLETATERAKDLTSSLLTFSRRQVAIRNPTKLADILARARPILERAAGERVTISTKDESEGAMAAVDSSQIELVLLNLVVNARDAMPDGGEVTISASTQKFERNSKGRPPDLSPGEYCKLSVSDTGTGIDNDAMPRVFEPFFTTKDVGSGTGLGLAAVYGAIHQHEGVVTIDTELGVGTTFTVYLPLCDSAVVVSESPAEPAKIGGREKILLVEDDALVRSVTVRALKELGYEVLSVSTAEQALDLVDEIDLVLTDVRLPRMPGTKLAEIVATDHPALPIVLMSGLVEDNEQKRVIESERFLFLSKPFTPIGLAKRIREALGD